VLLLLHCLASSPNELGRPPQASLLWQARRNVLGRLHPLDPLDSLEPLDSLAFEEYLAK